MTLPRWLFVFLLLFAALGAFTAAMFVGYALGWWHG